MYYLSGPFVTLCDTSGFYACILPAMLVVLLFSLNVKLNIEEKTLYKGCSIYNETVLTTFTFYQVQRHKYYKH